ncbi:Arylsulphatase [Fusarium tjaetaba]|uniref:Arylsulfatase n=1 Tax=Fusarium tjaetaba TaxID=1567544 RepID=A0A8H5VHQ6_9HYPO|nr:Arylsulphatase [Fusarium tjaetaba]KAF5622580.1 Arylsulphatase [Fusarium tjaetaba]
MRLLSLSTSVALATFVCHTLAQTHIHTNQNQQILSGKLEKSHGPPNIVFILTDDQDLHLNSLEYQPLLKKYLREEGTTFSQHYCTIALCCPSRVSLWTGKAAHNTNVTDVSSPYGGYPKFISQGLNENWLPVWLQDAGYNTYYTGKLFNEHTVDNYHSPYPKGFTGSDFLLDPFTYQYLNSSFQRNRDPPVKYEGRYSPDVIAEKAYGFLDEAAQHQKPFFLGIAPPTCHSNVYFEGLGKETLAFSPPIAAERHQGLFADAKVPRTYNFNPDTPSGVSWIKELPKQSEENVDFNDHFYRQRLRALQSTDEMVEGLVQRLEANGQLDNTYIVYTTDNGYHIGQHRLQPGKTCGYEEDINIPLIIRGPGVPKNQTTNITTTHTDMAPTIFEMIGLPPRHDFDGVSIPLTAEGMEKAKYTRHEHVNIEYWGFNMGEERFIWNNTYKAIRVIGDKYNLYYSVYCNNEHELYDLKVIIVPMHISAPPFNQFHIRLTHLRQTVQTDPGQMNNLLGALDPAKSPAQAPALLGLPLTKVLARLDTLLLVLKSCKGGVCVQPWKELHADGSIKSLLDALDPEFDDFYEEQSKVSFGRCEEGYILDAEGPQFE